MDQKEETNVSIAGISDKRSITATFSITLDNKYLPMQLIYRGETGQSLPKVKFPDSLTLSVYESHYSNKNEALKFIEEIILPYIREEREELGCPSQKVFLIFDVFRGQTTDKALKVLEDNNTLATKFPPNMAHLLQPLDLTVNKVAKDFTKKKFWEWFSRQISIGLENGQELEDIEINYHLSVLKPLHETWLISLYDYISSPEDKVVIASRWRKSGIFNAAELGLSKLRVFDSFNDICLLMEVIPPKGNVESHFPVSTRTRIIQNEGSR